MGATALLRFRNRGTGIFPAEAIAVPRTLLNLEFDAVVPKLVAEFWPAVRDDVEGSPERAVSTPRPSSPSALLLSAP
jgi:hypothetical protein